MNISRVVMLTGEYWNGLEYQRHYLAREFLKRGIQVYFVERLPQRPPSASLSHLRQWLFKEGYGSGTIKKKDIPGGLKVVNFRSLPPAACFRPLNRLLAKRAFAPYAEEFADKGTLLISYVPSYTQIDIAGLIHPAKTLYVSVHNYDADRVSPDLLKAEAEIINSDAVLAADSVFNTERLKRLAPKGKPVHRLAPGVDYELFRKADTGRPARYKKLCYFGGIGPHLDMPLYNALAKELEVTFIGVVDDSIRDLISPGIQLRPPVPAEELPGLLAAADMLGIFYKSSPYIDGVLPAKLFECLATGKPLLVSGMGETKPYADIVYDCTNNALKALDLIAGLPEAETPVKLELRRKLARDSGWGKRFDELMGMLT